MASKFKKIPLSNQTNFEVGILYLNENEQKARLESKNDRKKNGQGGVTCL